jgi:hypothetical protein
MSDETTPQDDKAMPPASAGSTAGEDRIFVCTQAGGFGRYVRAFFNCDGRECIVYQWALGYATAFREDVKMLPTSNHQEALRLAREAWGLRPE